MISYIIKFMIITFLVAIVGCSSSTVSRYEEENPPTCYLIMPMYSDSHQAFILVNLDETPPTIK